MTKKKYKKVTKKQLAVLKEGWAMWQRELNGCYKYLTEIEAWMSKTSGIEGVEFFMCDNEYVGIGNVSRSIKLIQREKLE